MPHHIIAPLPGSSTPRDGALHKNIQTVAELEHQAKRDRSLAHRLGDPIANFAGTMPFIFLHLLWFGAWVLINMGRVPGMQAFDPYPFTFLTFCVSLEAIILSAFVLMSQNRMSRQSDERAHLDLQINLLAEQESTEALHLLQQICAHLGVPESANPDAAALAAKTNAGDVAQMVRKQLP